MDATRYVSSFNIYLRYLQSNWFDNQSAVVLTLGERLEQLEQEKGIVVRFMIGHRYSFVDYFLSSINQ